MVAYFYKGIKWVHFKFSFMHHFPVGETPTGSGLYWRVSPPACENLKCDHP